MGKLAVAPTRSNLLRMKKQLSFAKDGFDMLEQKRQILVLELVSRVEAAKRLQQEVDEKMAAAFSALRTAVSRSGSFAMRGESLASSFDYNLRISSRSLMGIAIPEINLESQAISPQFGLAAGSAASDAVLKTFYDAMQSVARLAEVENTVFRLAREVRKTQRRVNALEKIFIPSYNDTLLYITNTLEEREREGFVIMRMVKERREKLRRLRRG